MRQLKNEKLKLFGILIRNGRKWNKQGQVQQVQQE